MTSVREDAPRPNSPAVVPCCPPAFAAQGRASELEKRVWFAGGELPRLFDTTVQKHVEDQLGTASGIACKQLGAWPTCISEPIFQSQGFSRFQSRDFHSRAPLSGCPAVSHMSHVLYGTSTVSVDRYSARILYHSDSGSPAYQI